MSDDELAYGGVCPVCGDEFTDGFSDLEQGESVDARVCIVDKGADEGEALIHLPEKREANTEQGGEQA